MSKLTPFDPETLETTPDYAGANPPPPPLLGEIPREGEYESLEPVWDFLTRKMASLGETAEMIADSFRREKITGYQWDGSRCPEAMWLQRQVSTGRGGPQGWTIGIIDVGMVVAGEEVVSFQACLGDSGWLFGHVPVTAAMADFASRFEAGEYPDLVEGPLRRRGAA